MTTSETTNAIVGNINGVIAKAIGDGNGAEAHIALIMALGQLIVGAAKDKAPAALEERAADDGKLLVEFVKLQTTSNQITN